ncbi:MAG: hypothetical protein ABIZ81_07740 [Opitutaceae bacterium]
MKKILFISVAANLALLALVVSSNAGKDPVAGGGGTSAGSPARLQGTAVQKNADGSVDTSDIDPAVWKAMATGDLATQVARMRDAGFPETIVRRIAAARLSEQLQERRLALRASLPKAPYWQNEQASDPKIRAAERQLSNEYTNQMKELFGTTAMSDDPMYLAQQRLQYGDLPRGKIEQIGQVQSDYNELFQKIYDEAGMGTGGPITIGPDLQNKLTLLGKEQRADIVALLTPQEAEDYEFRTGTTANRMRSQLAAFNPNEPEFRAIHKLQSAYDAQYNLAMAGDFNSPANQEMMRQRSEAQKELTAQIKQMLGDERGAEYERAVDGSFQQVYRVVERLELPKEAAVQAWTVQKEIQERMVALSNDRSLTPVARNAQMGALAQEAATRVSAALGDRGYDVYKQYGGAWIQSLERQAAAPVRPAAGAAGGARGGGGGGAIQNMIQTR